jgi:hypothetical protein
MIRMIDQEIIAISKCLHHFHQCHSLFSCACTLQLVYAQVSQESIPLGPLATLMPLLQMAGVLNETAIKNALKVSWLGCIAGLTS